MAAEVVQDTTVALGTTRVEESLVGSKLITAGFYRTSPICLTLNMVDIMVLVLRVIRRLIILKMP